MLFCVVFVHQPLRNLRVKESDRVTLTVRIEGRPEPVVRWYREGCIIEHSPDYHISQLDKDFTLVIAEVFPEDSGVFKCVATNAEGTTTSESRLEVERELEDVLWVYFLSCFAIYLFFVVVGHMLIFDCFEFSLNTFSSLVAFMSIYNSEK